MSPVARLLGRITFAAALVVVAARQLFPSIDADAGSGALFVLAAWSVGLLACVDLLFRAGPSAPIPLFVFLVAISTALASYKYPALHMLGEWIGVLCVWAAVRRAASSATMKQVALLVVILAISESLLTWRQVRTEIPDLLERYRRGDVGMMRELVRAGVEPGFMFQARLEAGLPWGTFGHTNTLAGFLLLAAPFLWVTLAAAWSAPRSARSGIARVTATALFVLLMAALALTKGRSAWIGAAAAFAVLAMSSEPVRRTLIRRWPLTLTVAVLLGGVFLWKAGNAIESLRYRFEYWQGTLPIIQAHPWTGVGWGSFRDHYLEHKLARSSEEVADPHNFLMELAACVGIPAALAYLGWLTTTMRGLLRPSTESTELESPRLTAFEWLGLGSVLAVASGAIVALGYSSSWTDIGGGGLLVAFFALLVLERLIPAVSTRAWRTATAAAAIGLHVHLLAAGGISHPGIMLASWALVAAAGPSVPVGGWRRWRDFGLLAGMLLTGAVLGSLDLAGRTVERDPVLGRVRSVLGVPSQADAAARLYEKAVALTPRDADLWGEIARWRRRRMAESPDDRKQEFQLALAAVEKALELQPLRSQFWHERGMLKLEAASLGLVPVETTADAAEDVRRAALRYPNSPARQADGAFVSAAASQESRTAAAMRQALADWRTVKTPSTAVDVGERLGSAAARGIRSEMKRAVRQGAERALELDAATPHFDKKLLPAERGWLQALANELKRTGDAE